MGFDPDNDRTVTALIWLSSCAVEDGHNTSCQTTSFPSSTNVDADAGKLDAVKDGATVFPRYGLRVRADRGGLVLYSSYGSGPSAACSGAALHYAAPVAASAPGPKVLLQKWYYQRPVEPSSPPAPFARCDDGALGQCKSFLMAPPSGSLEVQAGLAGLDSAMAGWALSDADSARAMATSSELAALRTALTREVAPGSLGRSAHWRAMSLVGYFDLLGARVGLGGGAARRSALEWLRAAVRRCPVCEDILMLHAMALVTETGERGEEAERPGELPGCDAFSEPRLEAREAIMYARRLAAMGVAASAPVARSAAEQLTRLAARCAHIVGHNNEGALG